METQNKHRRKTDISYADQLKHILLDGDISMVLLLGGLGLWLWASFGVWRYTDDLAAYAAMFPFGNGTFWVANYYLCGLAMWWLVAARIPPLASLLIGGWIGTIWSWSLLARTTAIATLQTGNATSIVYIIIGLLIVHRGARR